MAVNYHRATEGAAVDQITLIAEGGQVVTATAGPFEGDLITVPNTAFGGSDDQVRAAVIEAFPQLVEGGTFTLNGNFGLREGRAARRASPTFPA